MSQPVLRMRWIACLAASGLGAFCSHQRASDVGNKSPHILAVHVADYDGARPDALRIESQPGEAPLFADPTPILDERDFSSVSVAGSPDGLKTIRLCFKNEGRAKFGEAIRRNLGKRFVFLIRGKLLFAPIVDSSDVEECAVINGFVTDEDAAALKRAIQAP